MTCATCCMSKKTFCRRHPPVLGCGALHGADPAGGSWKFNLSSVRLILFPSDSATPRLKRSNIWKFFCAAHYNSPKMFWFFFSHCAPTQNHIIHFSPSNKPSGVIGEPRTTTRSKSLTKPWASSLRRKKYGCQVLTQKMRPAAWTPLQGI